MAVPRPGEAFPQVAGTDVAGHAHNTREFAGRRTLVVAITERDASEAMRAWNNTAHGRLPPGVSHRSIVSLRLPFYAPTEMVRSRARAEVPQAFWGDTLLDRDGEMGRALGLPHSDVPFAFVLDPAGRVVAAAHCAVTAPEAQSIWTALAGNTHPAR